MSEEKLGVIIFKGEIKVSDIVNEFKNASIGTDACIPIDIEDNCRKYCVSILDGLSKNFDIRYVSNPESAFTRICLNIRKSGEDELKVSIGPRIHLSSFCSDITKIIEEEEDLK